MIVKILRSSILLVYFCFWIGPDGANALFSQYPERPLTIINSNKPGGVIDIMSRKLATVAKKYADVTIVVENFPGGGGAAAMNYVLNQPADGYTLLATLKSFISTSLMSESGMSLNDFHLVAALVYDWEALITNRNSEVVTFEDIVADARRKDGRQKWLGPNTGGMDHLMALEVWEKCNIQARWIPFEGSALSITALLGGNGVVYVGNAIDIKGRPDLQIAAVASPARLPDFPEVPTFQEKGFDLTQQMWRGFAVKKGTPPKELAFLEDLFYKISQDEEWQNFIKAGYAEPVFEDHASMEAAIQREEASAKKLLTMAGIISASTGARSQNQWISLALFLLGGFMLTLAIYKVRSKPVDTGILLFTLLIGLPIYVLYQTYFFPQPMEGTSNGPALMPRIWAIGLLSLTLALLFTQKTKPVVIAPPGPEKSQIGLSLIFLLAYAAMIPLLGFYLSSLVFIVAVLWQLGFKKPLSIGFIVAGFLALIFLLFEQALNIDLPKGMYF